MKKGEQKLGRTKTTVHTEGEKEAVQQGAAGLPSGGAGRWTASLGLELSSHFSAPIYKPLLDTAPYTGPIFHFLAKQC